MIFSLILGGIIGFERRASERPAGIRTSVYICRLSFCAIQCGLSILTNDISQSLNSYLVAMVCLGSCFFCMTSQLAFKSSTMGWDAARVAAAVPSGVGFLGAGLIWKGSSTASKEVDGEVVRATTQEVHGLTTAASVWLSAAVGVAVGGGRRLYIVSVYGVMLVILVLRFGPQLYLAKDSESVDDWDDDDSELDWESFTDDSSDLHSQCSDENIANDLQYKQVRSDSIAQTELERQNETEMQALMNKYKQNTSARYGLSHSSHASSPNLRMMTYEMPIKGDETGDDKSRAQETLSPKRRRSRRQTATANLMKLSFHG